MIARIAAAAILALLPAAASKDTSIDALLAGRIAGQPVDCVDADWAGNAAIVDDHTLLYRQTLGRWWRNDLPDRCPGLSDDDIMVVDRYGSQICRNDHFRYVERDVPIPGPTCRFGRFVPYDLPRATGRNG